MIQKLAEIRARFAYQPSTEKHFFELAIIEECEIAVKQLFGPYDDRATCEAECDKTARETRDLMAEMFGCTEIPVQ